MHANAAHRPALALEPSQVAIRPLSGLASATLTKVRRLSLDSVACLLYDGLVAIVALCGQKGGSGKSTLAVNLAAEWHERGHSVLLVDLDPQGTAITWKDVADESGVEGPTVVGMGDSVRSDLPNVARAYDHVVLDCPPRIGKRIGGALAVADLALLPCGPSGIEVWAMAETLELIETAQGLRDDLDVRIVMNRVSSTSSLGAEAEEGFSEIDIGRMATRIYQRVALPRSMSLGLGVTQAEPNSLAAAEISTWVDEIEGIVGKRRRRVARSRKGARKTHKSSRRSASRK